MRIIIPNRRDPRGFISALLLLACTGMAHKSPEHVVDALTARMAELGPTPRLLVMRATEYRALRLWKEAEEDLLHALRLHPDHALARATLARVYADAGKLEAARATVDEAIELLPSGSADAASLLMVRAEIQMALAHYQAALRDCAQAMKRPDIPLDWYLIRSQIQAHLGRHGEAAEGLLQGYQATGSFVLRAEWIETLIDAGQHGRALALIEKELEASRWKASWWLRRGRARLGLGRDQQAFEDFHRVVEATRDRLRSSRPDLLTLTEHGLALALLDRKGEARKVLERARRLGGDPWLLGRLTQAIKRDAPIPLRP